MVKPGNGSSKINSFEARHVQRGGVLSIGPAHRLSKRERLDLDPLWRFPWRTFLAEVPASAP